MQMAASQHGQLYNSQAVAMSSYSTQHQSRQGFLVPSTPIPTVNGLPPISILNSMPKPGLPPIQYQNRN
jgi:hypothetical protein